MTALLIVVLLAFPSRAAAPSRMESPDEAVARIIARVDAYIASEKGKDAREIDWSDKRAQKLNDEIAIIGRRAVPALAAAVSDKKRAPKARLMAVCYLGLVHDPSAFDPLDKIAADREQDPPVRAVAAQSLSMQNVSDATMRLALCGLLEDDSLPQEVLEPTLITVSRLGCPTPTALVRLVRSAGSRPVDRDLGIVRLALSALGRSRGKESLVAILDLMRYFPNGGEARSAAIAALDARREEAARWHRDAALPLVVDALRSETNSRETMLPLLRIARALGEGTAPSLSRLSDHPDAEVLAEAAEALAAFKYTDALPGLEKAVAGAMTDPRFSPKEGRPDPAALLARAEKAVDALRREKTSR